MPRQKYTYIPKEEIASITTFNNIDFENKDILDGAYVRGRKKYGEGGMPYAKGGKLPNVKYNFTLQTPTGAGNYEEDELNDEIKKINLLRAEVDFDEVKGNIDYEKGTNLKFYKDGKLVMTLKGNWDSGEDKSIIQIYGEEIQLDYHPIEMSGLDWKQLKKNIRKAFSELKYSVVVSIDGYEEYSEDVEGLENAKARLQEIKENTRFELLKGSTVGIGKRVSDSKVVESYGSGGGVESVWGGVRGGLNQPMLSFSKVDYDVNVNPENMEVDVNIKENDTVDYSALNDTDVEYTQYSWGYMIYPQSVEQLYDVLKALKTRVSKKRLNKYFKGKRYENGGDVGMAKGGRPKSAIMRDRAYRSNEPHELKYKRKTSPRNPRYRK